MKKGLKGRAISPVTVFAPWRKFRETIWMNYDVVFWALIGMCQAHSRLTF